MTTDHPSATALMTRARSWMGTRLKLTIWAASFQRGVRARGVLGIQSCQFLSSAAAQRPSCLVGALGWYLSDSFFRTSAVLPPSASAEYVKKPASLNAHQLARRPASTHTAGVNSS